MTEISSGNTGDVCDAYYYKSSRINYTYSPIFFFILLTNEDNYFDYNIDDT